MAAQICKLILLTPFVYCTVGCTQTDTSGTSFETLVDQPSTAAAKQIVRVSPSDLRNLVSLPDGFSVEILEMLHELELRFQKVGTDRCTGTVVHVMHGSLNVWETPQGLRVSMTSGTPVESSDLLNANLTTTVELKRLLIADPQQLWSLNAGSPACPVGSYLGFVKVSMPGTTTVICGDTNGESPGQFRLEVRVEQLHLDIEVKLSPDGKVNKIISVNGMDPAEFFAAFVPAKSDSGSKP